MLVLTDTNVGYGPLTVNFTNTSDPYNGEDTTSMSFDWYINNILQTGTTNFTYTFPNIPEDTNLLLYNVNRNHTMDVILVL